MKTQVIRLDSHDNMVSIKDRMSWAKTARILLVLPRYERLLARDLDLLLLRRHAVSLGAQLGLVTRFSDLRAEAEGLSIPVFRSVTAAQREPWLRPARSVQPSRRRPRPDIRALRASAYPPEPTWRNRPAIRLFFFILALLAILALLLTFIPSSKIIVEPVKQSQRLVLRVSASPQAATVSMAGNLPSRTLSGIVAGHGQVWVDSTSTIPDQAARGRVIFRNLTESVVGIPAGTVVRTLSDPPVRFATISDGVVPAGIGESVEIPIQALEPGEMGNLPPGTLIAIEGNLGTSLTVSNPEATGGGTSLSVRLPTDDDRARLRESVWEQLHAEALDQFTSMVSPGDILFPGTLTVTQTILERYLPEEGKPGEALSLTLQLQFQIQYASVEDVESVASVNLDADLPADFEAVPGTLTISPEESPVTDLDGTTSWLLETERLIRPRLDPIDLAQSVCGMAPADAREALHRRLQLEGYPYIELLPDWWPWLPFTPFRIEIEVR